MKQGLIISVIIFMCSRHSTGLTVYDCNDPDISYQSLDLTEPADCPDPEQDYMEAKNITVQILQTDVAFPVTAYRCRVTISKKVTRCGHDSITYGSQWPVWEKDIEITPSECRNAMKKGIIHVEKKAYGFSPGSKNEIKYFSEGGVRPDGSCLVSNFNSEGIFFQKSYEETSLTIDIQHVRGRADLSTGVVVFNNGLRANFKDQVMRDHLEGTMVWNDTIPECQKTLSQIYLGDSLIYRPIDAQGMLESIIMVNNPHTSQYAGLLLQAPLSICQVHCYSTQVKGLNVCLLREYDTPLKADFNPGTDMKDANIQTQLSFLHLRSSMNNQDRFNMIQGELCEMEKRTMANKLQSIAGADNPYALLDIYGKGHTIYRGGAAAYLTRCVPKEAVRSSFNNCTEEIPVLVNGTLKFADPFTWIVKDFPVIVPCSDIMPVQWKIRGTWYCSSPRIQKCPSPGQLNLTIVQSLEHMDFTEGLGEGIYTKEQEDMHAAFTIAAQSRKAVLSDSTNHGTQSAQHPGVLGLPLGPTSVHELTNLLGQHYFPFFWLLGNAWNHISGFMLFFAIIQIFASCMVRSYLIFCRRGCGLWMFGALWETFFIIAMTPGALIKATVKSVTGTRKAEGSSLLKMGELQDEKEQTDEWQQGPQEGIMSYKELCEQLRILQSRQELYERQQNTQATRSSTMANAPNNTVHRQVPNDTVHRSQGPQ